MAPKEEANQDSFKKPRRPKGLLFYTLSFSLTSIQDLEYLLKLKSTLTRIPSQVWYKGLPISSADETDLIDGGNKRIICSLPGLPSSNCTMLSDGKGDYFIILNESRCKKIGLVLGEEIEFQIEQDKSELGMTMSDEFAEVMNQFDEAKRVFDVLTPGKKRSLIYWADNVKSAEIKVRRAIMLCTYLEANKDDLDFKTLNQEMKEANRLARLSKG